MFLKSAGFKKLIKKAYAGVGLRIENDGEMMELMYPKPKRVRKRKRHQASILHEKDGTCYLCMKLNQDFGKRRSLHEHHVFGGANRPVSEAEGLKVYLCLGHHTEGPEAVHNNWENRNLLQRDGQQAFEANHSREEFLRLIGKNYLEKEEESGQQEAEENGQL